MCVLGVAFLWLFDGRRCLLVVGCLLSVCCLLFVAWCVLIAVRWLSCVVCGLSSSFVVCC